MDEIRASSWSEINDFLYAESWQESLGRFRSSYAFRGMTDAADDLRTSLMRQLVSHEHLERPLLRTFRRYAQRDVVPGDSVWNWLAVAQHHGLPTRLLDWTYSPFVALHFATHNLACYDRDGVVWAIDYVRAMASLPPLLQQILKDEGANVFTAEMLSRSADSLEAFDSLTEQPFVTFFEPPALDDRIVNQYALFSFMSSPSAALDVWLRAHSALVRRLIIPAALKWEVRDKLDQANITERVLFPGLDGLSRWLARYYRPRYSADQPSDSAPHSREDEGRHAPGPPAATSDRRS
jgi:hypothetical protein